MEPAEKKMVRWIFLMTLTLLTSDALATSQISDVITYEGVSYNLHTNPLEKYFQKYSFRRPSSPMRSSALWRGYVASFEFRNQSLYVVDVSVQRGGGYTSVLNEVSPHRDGRAKPFKADWYSGLLVLPHGEMTRYVHMGYGSEYEHYIVIEVKNGHLKRAVKLSGESYALFKDMQFQAYKHTAEYQKQRDNMLKDGWSQARVDSFLRSYVTDYTQRIFKGALNFPKVNTDRPKSKRRVAP